MNLTNFILINFSLIASSFFIFFAINKERKQRFSHVLLSIIVLFFSLVTLITVGLGIFGKISFLNVTIISYTILAVLLFFARRKFFLKNLKEIWNTRNKSKSNFLLGIAIFTPVVVLLLIKFFITLFQIPLEFDALVYHLPIVTEWLQTGSLMDIYYTAFAGPLAYYPSNFDLAYLWSILPFRNDFLINLINFPLYILLAAAIYLTSINFGISKKVSLFVSAFPLYLPVFLQQAGTIFVDIYFVLTFVLSIYFLQEVAKDTKNITNSILFGLAIGLFMGTKYLGLPYGSIPLLIFLFIHLAKKERHYGTMGLGLFASLLTGAFFYIRNWVNSGNPLFPVDIKLFGKTLFEGYPNASDKLTGSSLFEHINEPTVIKDFFKAFWTMTDAPGFLILLSFIALLVMILFSFRRKNLTKQELITGCLLLTGGIIYFLLYLKAPYSHRDLIHNIRYAMPLLMLGIFSSGFVATKIRKIHPFFYLVSILAFIHSLVFLVLSPTYKIRFDFWILAEYKAQLIIMAIGIFALVSAIFLRRKKIMVTATIILAVIPFVYIFRFAYYERETLASHFYESWYPEDNKYFGIWNAALWLDKNNPKANIAYSGFHFHYPLFGRQLGRSVDYININNCANCRYVDYKKNQDSIRRDPDYDAWITNLKIKEKEYIIIDDTITPEVKSYELEWIRGHPEKFELSRRYNNTFVYKIK